MSVRSVVSFLRDTSIHLDHRLHKHLSSSIWSGFCCMLVCVLNSLRQTNAGLLMQTSSSLSLLSGQVDSEAVQIWATWRRKRWTALRCQRKMWRTSRRRRRRTSRVRTKAATKYLVKGETDGFTSSPQSSWNNTWHWWSSLELDRPAIPLQTPCLTGRTH